MESNKINFQKVSLIPKVLIYYYRIFGITFGGLVERNGELVVNEKFKLFGNLVTISLIGLYIITSRCVFDSRFFDQIYASGFTVVYYLIILCREIRDILVIINLYYYQFKGFELFKVLVEYKITKTKYKLFILILYVLHLSVQVIYALIYLTCFKTNLSLINAIISVFLNTYITITLFAIHFITWGKNKFPEKFWNLNISNKIFSFFLQLFLYQWLNIWLA
jgi:hypothetical protein